MFIGVLNALDRLINGTKLGFRNYIVVFFNNFVDFIRGDNENASENIKALKEFRKKHRTFFIVACLVIEYLFAFMLVFLAWYFSYIWLMVITWIVFVFLIPMFTPALFMD